VAFSIGKIPKFLDELTVEKLLEACGKFSKWNRPSDSNTNQPKPFGFCTFSTGVSALRCKNVLSDFDLSPYCVDPSQETGDLKLQVKAGSKEQAVLESLVQVSTLNMYCFDRCCISVIFVSP
jgi:hypothetical protein